MHIWHILVNCSPKALTVYFVLKRAAIQICAKPLQLFVLLIFLNDGSFAFF
jgi:hypothetical protein